MNSIHNGPRLYLVILVSILSRFLLRYIGSFELCSSLFYVVVPRTSFHRLKECIHLRSLGIDPYSSDICHHTPLTVSLFSWILPHGEELAFAVFVAADVLAAVLLTSALTKDSCQGMDRMKDLVKPAGTSPELIMATYLLSPFTLLSCLAMSTTSIENLLLSAIIHLSASPVVGSLWGSRNVFALAAVSLATYEAVHPVVLCLPLVCRSCIQGASASKQLHIDLLGFARSLLMVLCSLVLFLGVLHAISFSLVGSWKFVDATVGFILQVPDLTPNTGLFWYLFSEMFEHFHMLFLWMFQAIPFVLSIPISLAIGCSHPLNQHLILLAMTSLLKSYPAVGDLGIPITMLTGLPKVRENCRSLYLGSCFGLFACFLAPYFLHLWLRTNSGNANFYYAVTLAYSSSQVIVLIDMLRSICLDQYFIRHGTSQEDSTTKPVLR